MDHDKVKAIIHNREITSNTLQYREGARSSSLVSTKDGVYFVAGYEFSTDHETAEGMATFTSFKPIQFLLFGNGLVCIGSARSTTEVDWATKFLNSNFTSVVQLEPLKIEEQVLRTIAETNPNVSEIQQEPLGIHDQRVFRLIFVGKRLTQAELFKEHEAEPLWKIKVDLDQFEDEVRVSFCRDGYITIFSKNPELQLACLRSIADLIFLPQLPRVQYQSRLFST